MNVEYIAELIRFSHHLADISGEVIRPYFRTHIAVDSKTDRSPVTEADREGERAMRARILKQYPDHGIWGEEFGQHNVEGEFVWVLDPVDGTKSFVAGFPTFGTLIALTYQGTPLIGVIDQPISGERWIGAHGLPAYCNQTALSTSSETSLANAVLSTTSPDLLSTSEKQCFDRVRAKARFAVYGYDCYAYAQLASGHIHAVIETGLKPHDFCALAPVVESAGGVMTDWEGNPLTMRSDGKVIAAANPALHKQIMATL